MINIRHSLVSKLVLSVGITLLFIISTWAYFNIKYHKEKIMQHILAGAEQLSNTIKLGTHYAMMQNSRDDINQIINNIAKQKNIENIRIYNKEGQIKFSNQISEVDRMTNIKAEACDICHRSDPPLTELDLLKRTRIFVSSEGTRHLGVITSINNEPACSTGCHVHPENKKVLGALDVVISLGKTDREILVYQKTISYMTVVIFLFTSAIIFILMLRFVRHPINKLIQRTHHIAKGDYHTKVDIKEEHEIGQLAAAINQMGKKIGEKQSELNRQKDEYQNLFERVPCYITVQDRDYNLINYNQQFAETFNPKPGDKCYNAYKGFGTKCVNCPVEKTFKSGKSCYSEEKGYNRNGTDLYWMVVTSPLRDPDGNISATMEMCLDISARKLLEHELRKSEKKYHAIFCNMPNPVFVLDMNTLEILDCNESVKAVYEYDKNDIIGKTFMYLFTEEEKDQYAFQIKTSSVIDKVRHLNKQGRILFVNIRISPSEYPGQKVFLVTTSDITRRLEAEQQLIQAGKMATMGEMATGVAHELNQPLSVIKTVSTFFMKKINKNETIADNILFKMLSKIDSNVDRATNIINHMRQFSRKSDLDFEKVLISDVLGKAFEIFSQQLKVKGIDVVWEAEENLPMIKADPKRLEQVFINLLLNARDAIEERWGEKHYDKGDKKITLGIMSDEKSVICKICDTGTGIPEGVSDKIFEPFFTTKEVGKGTGLGLSISYGIVKECSGTIDSAPNNKEQGTCFVLKFPILEVESEK